MYFVFSVLFHLFRSQAQPGRLHSLSKVYTPVAESHCDVVPFTVMPKKATLKARMFSAHLCISIDVLTQFASNDADVGLVVQGGLVP